MVYWNSSGLFKRPAAPCAVKYFDLCANRHPNGRDRGPAHTPRDGSLIWSDSMNLDYPFSIGGRGGTAVTDESGHIRDMIEQLLFTSPGERVNRIDFGSGILQLVFAPNRVELASTLQYTIQAALQRWLGDLIDVQRLDVSTDDSTLTVELDYVIRRTNTVMSNQVFTRTARRD
jgi:phage baseplate assembly protein W